MNVRIATVGQPIIHDKRAFPIEMVQLGKYAGEYENRSYDLTGNRPVANNASHDEADTFRHFASRLDLFQPHLTLG